MQLAPLTQSCSIPLLQTLDVFGHQRLGWFPIDLILIQLRPVVLSRLYRNVRVSGFCIIFEEQLSIDQVSTATHKLAIYGQTLSSTGECEDLYRNRKIKLTGNLMDLVSSN